ncbi:MAG: hypothetical protein ACOYJB_04735 [Christensenellaceae bacterium]|jgi:hypothetical protein
MKLVSKKDILYTLEEKALSLEDLMKALGLPGGETGLMRDLLNEMSVHGLLAYSKADETFCLTQNGRDVLAGKKKAGASSVDKKYIFTTILAAVGAVTGILALIIK